MAARLRPHLQDQTVLGVEQGETSKYYGSIHAGRHAEQGGCDTCVTTYHSIPSVPTKLHIPHLQTNGAEVQVATKDVEQQNVLMFVIGRISRMKLRIRWILRLHLLARWPSQQ